jgi:hypothetical protein
MLLISSLFSIEIHIDKKQAQYIANKVWQNEGDKSDKYMIYWNDGERFLSAGIGHFIWFQKNQKERFYETFPSLLKFVQQKGVAIPTWLKDDQSMPWSSKQEFELAKQSKSKKYIELFNFLKSTIPEQANFMAQRFSKSLANILDNIQNKKQQYIIKKRFYEVMHNRDGSVNEKGLYALLDYTNFKGEGTFKSERYQGEGWGLLQVLYYMDDKEKNRQKAFALSASKVLAKRIYNAPTKRKEARWQKGWETRLETYWK